MGLYIRGKARRKSRDKKVLKRIGNKLEKIGYILVRIGGKTRSTAFHTSAFARTSACMTPLDQAFGKQSECRPIMRVRPLV